MSNIPLSKLSLQTCQFLKEGKLPKVDGVHKIYRLNIKDLKFNPYNDRFAMEISQYETDNNKKLGFDDESQNYLSNLLSTHKSTANQQTLKDILENGVLKNVVIDNRGIVLDGNRRLFILRDIINNPNKYEGSASRGFEFVNAFVIDEDNISEGRIRDLETSLQISEDEKVEYDPINIYLKIERLMKETAANNDDAKFIKIAAKFGPKYDKNDIKKRHKVYQEVMKDYLKFYSSVGKPILLKDREDHFKRIWTFKNDVKNDRLQTQDINYKDHKDSKENYENARKAFYILTSILYEGKAFRKIFPSHKKPTGILASKKCLNILLKGLETSGVDAYTQQKPSKTVKSQKTELIQEIIKRANVAYERAFPKQLKSLIEKLEKDISKIHAFALDPEKTEITKDAIDRLMYAKNDISKIIKIFESE